ncbi:hypothetical protein [Microbacterium sp. NPDC055665]
MSEVQVFYDELRAAAFDLADAVFVLQADASNLAGDTGVDAPLGRYSLKSALDRQVDALREATLAHQDASEALRTTLTNITDRHSDLDVELTGQEQP